MQQRANTPETHRSPEKRSIAVALQGGGSHGAFTWGVLDRLLEEASLGHRSPSRVAWCAAPSPSDPRRPGTPPKNNTLRLMMPRSQHGSGVWKASTRLTGRTEIATNSPISRFILTTLMRLAIGLVITALVVIGLTSPGGAQTTSGFRTARTPFSPEQQDGNVAGSRMLCCNGTQSYEVGLGS